MPIIRQNLTELIHEENNISNFYRSFHATEQLLIDSYINLTEQIDPERFFSETIERMNSFPKSHEKLWPEFMLHGIRQNGLTEVIDKIDDNMRIMLETTSAREDIIDQFAIRMYDQFGLKTDMCNGTAECNLGIWQSLLDKSRANLGIEYNAKIGFYLDATNTEAYIFSVQGKNSHGKRGDNFARVKHRLGIDPRGFLLNELTEFLHEQDYVRIKAIKPDSHPFAIINHYGYKGTHGQVLTDSGFNENTEYFEKCI